MASVYETFWDHDTFAVVGHSAKKGFPLLTYRGLKDLDKTVIPVDPSAPEIDGDHAYTDFRSLPRSADAVVLEVPKEETRDWIVRAADAGIHDVWIHMGTETPEALEVAEERGLEALSGHCAVMYVTRGFTYHTLHKCFVKLVNRY